MKKNNYQLISTIGLIWKSKLLLFMRATLFLVLLSITQVFAISTYSQSTRLSLELKNSSIKNILGQIEDQSQFYFIYDATVVNVERKTSIESKNELITEILDEIFKGSDVVYKINDRQIALTAVNSTLKIQQTKNISGKVTDSSGSPLPGVTVAVKGTTKGAVTNTNGEYSLPNIPEDATLQFSFVGMRTHDEIVGGRTKVDIVMEEDIFGIEEVVAIGYGMMKKSDLTGSVSSIKSESLVRAAPTKAAEALRGSVAGLSITQSNGKVGSDFKMTIRGMSSIDKANTPLVVIDGAMGGDLNILSPSDIETIDVLKDASACAIYGSKGANGVIIVTTKKGTKGKIQITYDGSVGFSTPVNIPDYMNVDQHEALLASLPEFGRSEITRTDEELYNLENKIYFDWFDAILQNGLKTEHNVALSGGDEKSNYYFSVGYSKNEGNIQPEAYNRLNLKAGIDSKISDKLSAGFSSYFTYSIRNTGSTEALRTAFRMRWTLSPWDEDGNLTMSPSGVNDYGNPLIEIQDENNSVETRAQNFMGNAYLEYKPIKGLSFRSSLSGISNTQRFGQYIGMYTKSVRQRQDRVTANYSPSQTLSYVLDNIINYRWEKNNHKLNLTAVNSISQERYEWMYLSVKNFTENTQWYAMQTASNVNSYSSGYYDWALVSFMGRANYTYKDKYLLTLTSRWDGSSKLAKGHKWDFFPSVALAWRASDEPFIQQMNVFSNLKFRLSYGEVGNDDIAPYSTQSLVSTTTYSFGSDFVGVSPSTLANSELGWERSTEYNLGIEAGWLDNKISLTADLYNRRTKGLIVGRSIPTDSGYSTITGNFASTRNKGIELTLNTVNISAKNFSWNTSINFAKNKNEILSLAEGLQEMDGSGIWRSYSRKYKVGEDILSHYYYEFDGIFQEGEETSELAQSMYGTSAQAGWVKVKDQTGDGKITTDDKKILGTETPSWTGGITNTLIYRDWDLSFFLYTVQDVFSLDGVWSALARADNYSEKRLSFVDYWTPSNPSNTWSSITQSDGNQFTGCLYLHNNSWVRLQYVTLGYSLPNSLLNKLGIAKLRFYATANNPLLFSDYKGKGFDPEWSTVGSNGVGVSAASYIFGVNVTF
ncbi:TonB-dependent receptor [Maribellus maritimus]|uniref:TonB-dependent receptor n=1 Tax=Maribellus maritimus TaxID=2870838 RepID=UPI001EEB8176|nr:TonB-dependent receptor [Maribellus maritimus]MCG6190909.1 TonB-dependent receptor [Maribellus maritimus]